MLSAEDIRRAFESEVEGLSQAVRAFPWEDRQLYALWLAQSYYYVQHTTRLLTMAASKYGPDHEAEHQAVLRHLREESGHDALALKDLRALGIALETLPELVATSVFYQTQYFWMDRCGPVALQGYALMLECLSARDAGWVADVVERHHGKTAARFLRVHAEDDIEHFARGARGLAAAEPRDVEAVLKNLRQSRLLYTGMLDAIVAHVRLPKSKARVA